MDGIHRQQYKRATQETLWEAIPVSTLNIQEYDSGDDSLVDIDAPIDHIWLQKKRCLHDESDSEGHGQGEGYTKVDVDKRSYTAGILGLAIDGVPGADIIYCRENIRIPRGQYGQCIRPHCNHYLPKNTGTWDGQPYSATPVPIIIASGRFYTNYGSSGYLCYPGDHIRSYKRIFPDIAIGPPFDWDAKTTLMPELFVSDLQGQRKTWTYKGGGNIVGRPPWLNIQGAELGQATWTYQHLAKKYDCVKIKTGAHSGEIRMIKKAIACYQHGTSDYSVTNTGSQATLPTDLSLPANVGLPVESGVSPSITSPLFRLDYLELYTEDGTGTELPSAYIGAEFDVIPCGTACGQDEVPIKIYEQKKQADDPISGGSWDGNDERLLTQVTDYTVNIVTGKVTFTTAYQAARVTAGTKQWYRIEWGMIDRASMVFKSDIEEPRELSKNLIRTLAYPGASETINFRYCKRANNDQFAGCDDPEVLSEQPTPEWSDPWYETIPVGEGFEGIGYQTEVVLDYPEYKESHQAKVFPLPWVPFGPLKSVNGSVTKAVARIRVKISSAKKVTFSSVPSVSEGNPYEFDLCLNGAIHHITQMHAYSEEIDIAADIPMAATLVFKRKDRFLCMNQKSIGVGGCLLINRPAKGIGTEMIASNCESRPPMASPNERRVIDYGAGPFQMLVDRYTGATYYNQNGKCQLWPRRSWDLDETPDVGDGTTAFQTTLNPISSADPPGFIGGMECSSGRTTGGSGGQDFYVANEWSGHEISGYEILSTTFPAAYIGDGQWHALEIDITGAIQYWMSLMETSGEQQVAGIIFSSGYSTTHDSITINPVAVNGVFGLGTQAGWEMVGDATSISADVEFDNILVTLKTDSADYAFQQEFPILAVNLPAV